MRSFSKKLAFVLAAAMVVTSFAPAAKAEAAKEMAINKSSQILYVNEGINHKGADGVAAGKGNVSVYDFSVKNKPADWKDTLSFKWTSSKEDVVTVKSGGVATAVGVGSATITCKVTDKATKETVATLKTKVTVKANAYDVEITNTEDADGLAFAVDSTIDLNRAMYDEDGNKTTKRGKLVTDYTRWVAVPDTGVTIDNATGKYTFAEPGEYELYCETYQSSKYTKTTAKSDSVFVTITKDLELTQLSLTKFDIAFGRPVADLAVADLNVDEVVVGTDGNTYKYDVLVKGIKMSDDKKTATVETYLPLTGDLTYEVTVKGYDMVSMVASDGDVVDVKVSVKDSVANQVNIGKTDVLQYALIDANKVDVTRGTVAEKNNVVFNIQYFGKNGTNYEMSYYANNANLFQFNEVGDYAVITAEYNTGKFDSSKNEEVKVTSEPVTFYAVAKQEITVKKITQYATDAADGWFNFWSADKDLVKMGQNAKLKFTIELADGKTVDVENQNQVITDKEGVVRGWIYVESVDEDVLDINDYSNAVLQVSPRKVGNAVFMVYHQNYLADGVTVMSTPVAPITLKVKSAPELSLVGLNYQGKNSATALLSIDAAEDALDSTSISIQFKDQYGKDYTNYSFVSFDGNSQQAKDIKANNGITLNGNSITVNNAAFKAAILAQNTQALDAERISGKYVYTLTYKDNNTHAQKSATIVVDIRGLTKDADSNVTSTVGVDSAWFTPNIARINDSSNEARKFAALNVFNKSNGANYSSVEMQPFYSNIAVGTAPTGYYFKVFKDGADITYKVNNVAGDRLQSDIYFDAATDSNYVQLNFSKTKTDMSGKTVVDYSGMGAGNYQLVVYKIDKSIYHGSNQTPVNVATVAANCNLNATCDPGKYTLASRDSVNVASNGTDSLDLLKCFTFKNRGGSSFNKYGNNSATMADFGGTLVPYYVNIDAGLSTPDSVYVKSVIFYEEVNYDGDLGDGAGWGQGKDANVFASYEVPVGYYVNINVAQ